MTELQKLVDLENNCGRLTIGQQYNAYHKITSNDTIDIHFDNDNYGIALCNVYNQPVATPNFILKQAKNQIQHAKDLKHSVDQNNNHFDMDSLSDACQQYYFWIKHTEDGPDQYRHLSESKRIEKGYQILVHDAKKMIATIKSDVKHHADYYLILNNYFLTTRYQTPVTVADMKLTIGNATSRAIYQRLQATKPSTLTPREVKAVFDVKYQKTLVELNWSDNWQQCTGTDNSVNQIDASKQQKRSTVNMLGIYNYSMNHRASVPAKDVLGKKIFKYNIADAEKYVNAENNYYM